MILFRGNKGFSLKMQKGLRHTRLMRCVWLLYITLLTYFYFQGKKNSRKERKANCHRRKIKLFSSLCTTDLKENKGWTWAPPFWQYGTLDSKRKTCYRRFSAVVYSLNHTAEQETNSACVQGRWSDQRQLHTVSNPAWEKCSGRKHTPQGKCNAFLSALWL